jgi:hypothetical protein
MDESSMDAFASVQVCPSTPRPHRDDGRTQPVVSDPSSFGVETTWVEFRRRGRDGAVECPEGPSDLDQPSVKERTARRKLSKVSPTTTATGSDAREATNCITWPPT